MKQLIFTDRLKSSVSTISQEQSSMNHIDPRGETDENGKGNYTCDNLEDALKQMEGLVEGRSYFHAV